MKFTKKPLIIQRFFYFYIMNNNKVLPYALFILFLMQVFTAEAQRKKKDKKDFERSPKQELVYDDKAYLPVIRTVQFYPQGKENQLPIYTLGSTERLLLTFDDLRADVRNYYLSIEHCNQDWTPSRTTVLDYIDGFNEDRIDNFQTSRSTFRSYTQYKLTFPTEYIKPKLAGNYILKVYEDADKSRLVLTRRFYVLNSLMQVNSTVQSSYKTTNRLKNQKLNINLTTGLTIQNPQRDLIVQVKQNQRSDNQMILQTPSFVGNNEFRYTNSETFDFKGNNEFRFVDMRSFRIPSERVQQITQDSITQILLYTDEDDSHETYAATFDENGLYFIRNRDLNDDALDADYADVTFSLKTSQTIQGNIYLVGGFNHFQRTEENKLHFDEENQIWKVTLRLKQGLYDYDYVLEDQQGNVITDAFSGTHFQTGNDYQIFIYNRRPGAYWDELVGFGQNSINNRN
ncbi:protein of unknown function [Sphingobacterium wenxiniae]|uniref:Type 9 secretion system plug protein N-terminal domain-containing protein n=2 Tax=Sphingobacterium wenxiniae TaxID=683125 RepID=A0A1I6P3S7_9SPHI|nr:protein of unknown function [Sphingobacterium wenxiniae]